MTNSYRIKMKGIESPYPTAADTQEEAVLNVRRRFGPKEVEYVEQFDPGTGDSLSQWNPEDDEDAPTTTEEEAVTNSNTPDTFDLPSTATGTVPSVVPNVAPNPYHPTGVDRVDPFLQYRREREVATQTTYAKDIRFVLGKLETAMDAALVEARGWGREGGGLIGLFRLAQLPLQTELARVEQELRQKGG